MHYFKVNLLNASLNECGFTDCTEGSKKCFLDFKWLQNSLIVRGQFEQLHLYMSYSVELLPFAIIFSVFHGTFNNAFVPSDCLNVVIFIAVPGAGKQHRLSLIQVFFLTNIT